MEPAARAIIWAPSAYADLDEALQNLGLRSTLAAERLLEEILDAAESLSTLSERGRLVPELRDGITRELIVGSHRLMYEVSAQRVEIVAVLYGARDFETWLREREQR